MLLAHFGSSSAPNVEILFLAVGLLVLGVLLFVQKTVKPAVPVILILLAIAAAAGSFAFDQHSGGTGPARPAPTSLAVSITAPEDEATVASGQSVVEVQVRGGQLIQGQTSNDPTDGHLHVYVDGRLATMTSQANTEVDLRPGAHRIEVEFTSADHRSFAPPITDTITVTAE